LADERRVHAEDVLEQCSECIDPIDELDDVVLDVAEAALELGVDPVLVEAEIESTQHADQRAGGPLELNDLSGELVDAARDGRVTLEYLELDLLDVVLQAVAHRLVGIGDLIEDRVENRLGTELEQIRVGLHPAADLGQVG
jgi:hypothetical protein